MRLPALLAALLLPALLPPGAGAAAGDLDPRFGTRGLALVKLRETPVQTRALAVQPDGKVLVAGPAHPGWMLTRLTAAGRPDRSFGTRGRVRFRLPSGYGEPASVFVQPDGRILVGGTPYSNGNTRDWFVVRLLRDGRPDPGWGDGGTATVTAPNRTFFGGMAVQPDGGVAVTGATHDRDQFLVVMRLDPQGRADRGFGDGGTYVDAAFGAGNAIVARPDGGLLVGGQTGSYYGANGSTFTAGGRELVLALTADGRVDTAWGREGRFVGELPSRVLDLQLAPDGGVVALDSLRYGGLLALTPAGAKRMDWGLEGRSFSGVYDPAAHVLDERGRVYVAGGAGSEQAAVARVDENGLPDRSFGAGGVARLPDRKPIVRSMGESVALAPGERVYAAASGADMEQGDREDYGYTHALVARLKGWDRLAWIHRVSRTRGSRRVAAAMTCSAVGGCRLRVEVRDRRGRLLARERRRRFGRFQLRNVRLTMRRPARRGERLAIRVQASAAGGRADTFTRRVRVR